MRNIKKILLSAFICNLLTTGAVHADTTQPTSDWYQINIIVFEHITPDALTSELWLPITNPPNVENLYTPDLLPQDDGQLKAEKHRLERSRYYKILYDGSWKQQIPITNKAEPLRITDWVNINGVNQLDGTITISRQKYFSLTANLILTEPIAYLNQFAIGNYDPGIANNNLISFEMQQTRRMKSKELNYFDHPLFGMLIKIMPIDQPVG